MYEYTAEEAGYLVSHVMNHFFAAMRECGLDEETVESIWTSVEGKLLADMMEKEITGHNPVFDE